MITVFDQDAPLSLNGALDRLPDVDGPDIKVKPGERGNEEEAAEIRSANPQGLNKETEDPIEIPVSFTFGVDQPPRPVTHHDATRLGAPLKTPQFPPGSGEAS